MRDMVVGAWGHSKIKFQPLNLSPRRQTQTGNRWKSGYNVSGDDKYCAEKVAEKGTEGTPWLR